MRIGQCTQISWNSRMVRWFSILSLSLLLWVVGALPLLSSHPTQDYISPVPFIFCLELHMNLRLRKLSERRIPFRQLDALGRFLCLTNTGPTAVPVGMEGAQTVHSIFPHSQPDTREGVVGECSREKKVGMARDNGGEGERDRKRHRERQWMSLSLAFGCSVH